MTYYEKFLQRKRAEHGEKFDESTLSEKFKPFFGTDTRIKVETCGQVVFGRVSVTTGWKPVFILMRRKSDYGSCWTLSDKDIILAIQQRNGKYI